MKYSGWGNYPIIESKPLVYSTTETLRKMVRQESSYIARGNGRSYGDSSLSSSHIVTNSHHYIKSFDKEHGILSVEAGILLSEILEVIVPNGWFLQVTPGTKLITVGGAIASDVHGKNHHQKGCFSESIIDFELMLPNGEQMTCSKGQNAEMFKATCGGMGLTGIITKATLSLTRILSSTIKQTTVKSADLDATFNAFEDNNAEPYSVAWIDCLASSKSLGRSLLMTGDFSEEGGLAYSPPRVKTVPFNFPKLSLNKYSVNLFNTAYYNRVRQPISQQLVGIDSFFYPLDALNHWNRMYGNAGFLQYQVIFPKENSYKGIRKLLEKISHSGRGSFLAVLKLYGRENENYLSFPKEGYSLAIDFKMDTQLLGFLKGLDEVVSELGGRHYLAKDVCVSRDVFERGYPHVSAFRDLRKKYGMEDKISSLQSKRLGI